jgi:hypothetical protein
METFSQHRAALRRSSEWQQPEQLGVYVYKGTFVLKKRLNLSKTKDSDFSFFFFEKCKSQS